MIKSEAHISVPENTQVTVKSVASCPVFKNYRMLVGARVWSVR